MKIIVDAMGGVDIEVTEEEITQMNDNLVHHGVWLRGFVFRHWNLCPKTRETNVVLCGNNR